MIDLSTPYGWAGSWAELGIGLGVDGLSVFVDITAIVMGWLYTYTLIGYG